MEMADDLILWFDSLGKDDVAVAGGKGANLGELLRAGIPVPPGFVVTAGCYRRFLETPGLRDGIAAALQGLDHRDHAALQLAARDAKARIEAAPLPDDVVAAVREAYARLGAEAVAVRSSATAEDLPDASFAGQQSTFLNVSDAGHVVDAVRACWASLFEPQAIAYRATKGYDHLEVAIAVPVQEMVQSECAGVMFTVNPVTADHGQIVIEAVHGLGEAAVSGLVTPDMYVIDKASLVIVDRSESEQEQELVRDPAGGGLHPNVWRAVPPERRRKEKLSDAQAAELARLGVRVEAHYGAPQDIEWAWAEGAFWLLQARPVTTL
jgi:pyruvate,water dikinase